MKNIMRLISILMVVICLISIYIQPFSSAIALVDDAIIVAGVVALFAIAGITFLSSPAAVSSAEAFLEEYDYKDFIQQQLMIYDLNDEVWKLNLTVALWPTIKQLLADAYDFCTEPELHSNEAYEARFNTESGSYEVTSFSGNGSSFVDMNGNSYSISEYSGGEVTTNTGYNFSDISFGHVFLEGDSFYLDSYHFVNVYLSAGKYEMKYNSNTGGGFTYSCNTYGTGFILFPVMVSGVLMLLPAWINNTTSRVITCMNYIPLDATMLEENEDVIPNAYEIPSEAIDEPFISEAIEGVLDAQPDVPMQIPLPPLPALGTEFDGLSPLDDVGTSLDPILELTQQDLLSDDVLSPAGSAEAEAELSQSESDMRQDVKEINEALTGDVALDFSGFDGLGTALAGVFPFCIPWDIKNCIAKFNAVGSAPSWEFDFGTSIVAGGVPVEINFDGFENVATVLRSIFLILFIISLALLTSKVIRW